jgi:hypothetical protein
MRFRLVLSLVVVAMAWKFGVHRYEALEAEGYLFALPRLGLSAEEQARPGTSPVDVFLREQLQLQDQWSKRTLAAILALLVLWLLDLREHLLGRPRPWKAGLALLLSTSVVFLIAATHSARHPPHMMGDPARFNTMQAR